MNWLSKLKTGLSKTSHNITQKISQTLTNRKLDATKLEELEDLLIMCDIGPTVAGQIIEELRKEKYEKNVTDQEIYEHFAKHIQNILSPHAKPLVINKKPHVILFCGVNGNGKTTTIGKIAHRLQKQGKKVVLAACDTFRAAAVEQLQIWGQRSQAHRVIVGELEADPASVAFRACEESLAVGADVLLIDTAGRLHNKTNLMEELAKVIRVIRKSIPEAPHNIILVLDATTGQNAISQVENFKNIVPISGLIITKLDGTAKAGIIVAIAKKFALPIYMIGVGEQVEDLDEFQANSFARNLFGI